MCVWQRSVECSLAAAPDAIHSFRQRCSLIPETTKNELERTQPLVVERVLQYISTLHSIKKATAKGYIGDPSCRG